MLKRLSPAARDQGVELVEQSCGRPPLRPKERERYEFLSWQQITTMAAAGVEFGSHTVTHPILSGVEAATLRHEIVASKQTLEEALRTECYAFAFPNGSSADYGQREKSALREAGYRCALSLRGTLNGRHPDLFELDRININRQHDELMFRAAVAGLLGRARRVRERWTAASTTREIREAAGT
jgi:peptidoglycan/xylan/chitin deacetylase (PgdA/CDA1 family)